MIREDEQNEKDDQQMQFWMMQLGLIILLPRMYSALDRLGMDHLGSRLVDNDGRWVFVEEQMRIGSCRD